MKMTEFTPEKLKTYIDELYNESGDYNNLRHSILAISLCCIIASAILSTISQPHYAYNSALFAFFFQIFAFVLIIKIQKIKFLLHSLIRNRLLKISYEELPSTIEVSHLIAKSNPAFNKNIILRVNSWCKKKVLSNCNKIKETICNKIKEILLKKNQGSENKGKEDPDRKDWPEFYPKDTTTKPKYLLSIIQENSFWNHHLYRSTFIFYSFSLFIISVVSIILLLYLLPTGSIDSNILRIALLILSFTIFTEFLVKVIICYDSSRGFFELDHEIEKSFEENSEINVISIFYRYLQLKETSPSIPGRLYKRNSYVINKTWKARVDKWKNDQINKNKLSKTIENYQ